MATPRALRTLGLGLAAIVLVSGATTAHAQSTASAPRRETPVGEFAPVWTGAGIAALGAGLTLFFVPRAVPSDPRIGVWRGGLLGDDALRSALRAPTADGEAIAATISDLLVAGLVLDAAGIDAILVPLLHDDPQLAWQAGVAYSLAVGLELTIGGIVKDLSTRARPYEASQCASDPSLPICRSGTTYQSFFSLHSGVAFTSAGFSCAMHLEHGLYGDAGADITSCGTSLLAATVVGLLRIVADAHYLSDVLVGAVTGFLVGYLVPLAVIPRTVQVTDGTTQPATTSIVTPMIDPGLSGGGTMLGLSLSGTF